MDRLQLEAASALWVFGGKIVSISLVTSPKRAVLLASPCSHRCCGTEARECSASPSTSEIRASFLAPG